MKCLIIAAGKGSRLIKLGDSKPLVKLLGVPLIERVIMTVVDCGIREFYVVTGYNGEKVRLFLDELSQKAGISIIHIINDDWKRGNGLSVLKAKGKIKGNFFLLMSDHIFDKKIILNMKKNISYRGLVLAVDYNIKNNPAIDMSDVTKIEIENNKIKDIGKNIRVFNAFDTGIFLCSSAIFTAIQKSVQKGDTSLSAGVQILAHKGMAKVFDIADNFWIDVDDDRSFKNAKKIILFNIIKKDNDGPVSKYLNRPISIRISKFLVKTPLSPNWISFLTFLLAIFAASFFFWGGYTFLVIGAVLAQFSSIIDGCDGEVARLKWKSTAFGGWFDAVLDRYADGAILFGISYYLYQPGRDFIYIIIGFLAIMGTFLNSYTADKYDSVMKKKLKAKSRFFRLGRDVRLFLVFLFLVFNLPLIALIFIALLMNFENIRRIILFYKYDKYRIS